MGLRDEIEYVIQEEDRKARRKSSSFHSSRTSSIRVKPTYFAVLIAKILYRFRRKPAKTSDTPAKPKPKKTTAMKIVKDDFRHFIRRLFPKKKMPKTPGEDESWKDWEGQI